MTYHPKSEFMTVMIERGFLADCTDYQGLDEALLKGGQPAYIGFDATAKSLHVGSLIQIMMLRWLQKTGGKPITLMGGGTTKVGDPSFRADERPLLGPEQIDDNIAGIKKVFSAYLAYEDADVFDRRSDNTISESQLVETLKMRFLKRFPSEPLINFDKQLRDLEAERLAKMYLREMDPEWPDGELAQHPKYTEVRQVAQHLRNRRNTDDASKAMMVNNAEWLDGLNYLDFLRDIGRHFSINRMLSFESVKSRLDREQSLSFLEFNYMILQAYDFMELHRRYGCIMQMGGSDQWGNIVNGIDLTRRVIDGEVFGLTSPLLTTSDGKKMGKSQSGAIWLNPDMLSPYEFWQFWRNTTDADVGRFLKLYTELPVDECDRLGALEGAEINAAKVRLANEITALLHGADAATAAEATAREVFEKGGVGDDLPTLTLSAADLGDGISIVQLIVKSGLAGSGKEAKRLISEGGARIDDAPLMDAGMMLDADALSRPIKLSAGKKRHALVQIG